MLLDEFCQDWNLLDPVLIDDRGEAELYRVNAPDGTACLEIFKRDLLPQGAAISTAYKIYKGTYVPELYASGPRAILMEYCEGQRLVSLIREGRAPAAMDAAARLVASLTKTTPPPAFIAYLQPLESALRPLFEEALPPFLEGVDAAAQAYLQTVEDKVLLHGSLIPEQIVYSEKRKGWIALEPLGLYGDATFEAGVFFAAFISALPTLDKTRVTELLTILIDKTRLERERVLSAVHLAAALAHLRARRLAGEEIGPHPFIALLKSGF
ncbi:MAG: aminoglycoside phosphotransferase family protein [Pseudobdellovibrionaceae bacterium]